MSQSEQPPPHNGDLADPAPNAETGETTNEGLRRFLDRNANLLRMVSIVFAAAAFLRAAPEDDIIAVLTFLLLIVATAIYQRLWLDLPRRLIVLPGEGWTLGLTVVYYCMAIGFVLGGIYLAAGFIDQRQKYLWVVLGTLLAVGGAAWLTHSASIERKLAPLLRSIHSESGRQLAAGLIVAVTLVGVMLGAYVVSYKISAPINGLLDQLFGATVPTAIPRL